jgi:hypothetical protein
MTHPVFVRRRIGDHVTNMLDAAIVLASLGFTNLSRIQYRVRYLIAVHQHARRPRNFVTEGQYRNRRGDLCQVSPNTDGWLDGLPFVVDVLSPHGMGWQRKCYTVDYDGLVYPDTPWRKYHDLVPNR